MTNATSMKALRRWLSSLFGRSSEAGSNVDGDRRGGDRRSGDERRTSFGEPRPAAEEQRTGEDRRSGEDRRTS